MHHYISTRLPYWNRNGGRDHMIVRANLDAVFARNFICVLAVHLWTRACGREHIDVRRCQCRSQCMLDLRLVLPGWNDNSASGKHTVPEPFCFACVRRGS